VRLRGYRHIFDPYTSVRWNFPHFYRKPGFGYEHLGNHRHSDVFNREYSGGYDDRYLSPYDGKIKRLVVQATDDIYDNTENGTWRRTFIRNISPFYLRLANWPLNHVDYTRNGGPTSEDWPMICVKWFIASVAITFVVSVTSRTRMKPQLTFFRRLVRQRPPKARLGTTADTMCFPMGTAATQKSVATCSRAIHRLLGVSERRQIQLLNVSFVRDISAS